MDKRSLDEVARSFGVIVDEDWDKFWQLYYAKKVPHPKTGEYYKGPAKAIETDTKPDKEESEYKDEKPELPTVNEKLPFPPTPKQKEIIGDWVDGGCPIMRGLDYGEGPDNPGRYINDHSFQTWDKKQGRVVTGKWTKEALQGWVKKNQELDNFLAKNSGHGDPIDLCRGASHSADFLKNVKVGHKFNFGAKTSFAPAEVFKKSNFDAYMNFSGENKYPTVFHVKTNKGVNISHLSKYDIDENLIPKSTQFMISKVIKKPVIIGDDKKTFRYDIWLEEEK